MTMNINSELEIMHLKSENDICQDWIPSLFSSILLIPFGIDIDHKLRIEERIVMNIPPLSLDEDLNVILFNYKFLNIYNSILGQVRFNDYFSNCYLGLSHKDSTRLNESYIFLNKLKENSHIDKKIFSFDKWTLMRNSIKSNLYLGDFHQNFIKSDKKKGIIASCRVNDNYPFWGCSFDSLGFKNNFISLRNYDNELYKIFFSTENYNIIFPNSFKERFYNITDNSCIEEYEVDEMFLTCANHIFNVSDYFNIKLIRKDFNITVEIDSKARFSLSENESRNKTRIKFSDIDYFIFPLIMFKNFDVQFDAENNIISFYTTDNSILSVLSEKEKSDKGLSKGLIALIVILSILVVLIIGFIIYRFMRIKKESNIQKDAKKIEEIEEFHSMN